MDQNLDQMGWWDLQSCREFEEFLDEMYAESIDWEELRALEAERQWEREHTLGEF